MAGHPPGTCRLGPPAKCPFSPTFWGGGFPYTKWATENIIGYPYSNLSNLEGQHGFPFVSCFKVDFNRLEPLLLGQQLGLSKAGTQLVI